MQSRRYLYRFITAASPRDIGMCRGVGRVGAQGTTRSLAVWNGEHVQPSDANRIEGSVPSVSSSLCIDNGRSAIIGAFSTASVAVAAITVSNGDLEVHGSGSSLTVTQDIVVLHLGGWASMAT